MGVVYQVAGRSRSANDPLHHRFTAMGLREEQEAGALEELRDRIERTIERAWRLEDASVRGDPEELVDTRPWDGPREVAFRQKGSPPPVPLSP